MEAASSSGPGNWDIAADRFELIGERSPEMGPPATRPPTPVWSDSWRRFIATTSGRCGSLCASSAVAETYWAHSSAWCCPTGPLAGRSPAAAPCGTRMPQVTDARRRRPRRHGPHSQRAGAAAKRERYRETVRKRERHHLHPRSRRQLHIDQQGSRARARYYATTRWCISTFATSSRPNTRDGAADDRAQRWQAMPHAHDYELRSARRAAAA
jgi:hypothetical protein